jgi:hypothetical protein
MGDAITEAGRLEMQVERLQAEVGRLKHERDALIWLAVGRPCNGCSWWWRLGDRVGHDYKTSAEAVAAVRRAAGLAGEG